VKPAALARGAPAPRIEAEAVPLIAGRDLAAPFAQIAGRVVSRGEFLGDVARVADSLPDRGHVFNVCADRYRFTVGFAAALCRGQISLLPPTRTPDFLARLAERHPDTYCLADVPAADMPFETVALRIERRGAPATLVPDLPAARVAAVSYTSGTTGAPMPHVKRWGALARGATAESAALGLDALTAPTLVGTVPPQHMYGFESTVLLALHGGAVLTAERPFYPADVRDALQAAAAPRVLITTPVHLRALVLDEITLPPLALIVCATAPLGADLAQAAEARFAAPVREIYGFTEAGMVASRRTLEGDAWTPLPGVRLRADGPEWWAEGGHVPEPARFADLIEVAADGRFVLQGRRSDVVNVAGKRASLASLDHHLQSIPGVVDGAYYVPEAAGPASRLGAFAVAPGLTARDVIAALRQRVDSAFLPRPLHLVDALPRNATGKLTQEALRRLERECASRR
jgi:acyl-coenzyme A synthetase/AMP-(fatty) acid ligase